MKNQAHPSKSDLSEPKTNQLAAQFKSLAHPARLAILKTLAERSSCICGEIVEVMPLAQSTVSQHLRELKRAGLIRGQIDGPRCCYCIDFEALRRFRQGIEELFKTLDRKDSPVDPDCCP